ncbi:hypothetical protein [Nocardia sp. NPDC057353]|uniref:hypothetical protein n=1 Tax=Nocardia sp. NPDC057353 TaxID=3346104 RepID=UPI003641D142
MAKTTTMTRGEVCSALKEFFAEELHALSVRTSTSPGDESEEVFVSGICKVEQGSEPVGRVELRHTSEDVDPTEGVPGFEPSTVDGVPVWIRDRTAHPDNPSTQVRFATRVDRWNVRLFIENETTNTATGPLRLTDENKREAARFLVDLGRRLSG